MMESMSIWLPGVLVMLGLVVASGFFSGSETALFYLSREEVESLRNGSRREQLAVALLNRPERLLAVILFWNLVVNLLFFTVGILTARRLIDAGYEWTAGAINVAGVVGIIVFGEVIPKSLAIASGRRLASIASVPLAASARILDPALPLLGTVASALARVRHPAIEPEPLLEPRDLDNAAKLSEEDSSLTTEDARIFRNVLDLFDLMAEDLMWPRPRFVPIGRATIDGEERSLLLSGDVVVDLYDEGDFDRIIAVHRLPEDWSELSSAAFQPLVYVPWCAPAVAATRPLLDEACLAVGVVNEYGDVLGIVTADDALEPIVNPSASRARRLLEREPVVILPDGRARVEGITLLRVLAERLELSEEAVALDSGDSRTVAGLIHDRLDRFANVGDELMWMGRQMTIVKATGRGEIVVEIDDPAVEGDSAW